MDVKEGWWLFGDGIWWLKTLFTDSELDSVAFHAPNTSPPFSIPTCSEWQNSVCLLVHAA